jgi:hypothetical protein
MEKIELILVDHPPHCRVYKRIGFPLPRLLFKVFLFLAIIIVSFHLLQFNSTVQCLTDGIGIDRIDTKEETIHEMLTVLEKYPTGLTHVAKEELAKGIYEEATRYNHDPKFILALIAIESSFQNRSVSERGAIGLMQIMPFVAESIAQEMGIQWNGDRTLLNPYLNIRIGVYYLSRLILDFHDMGVALAAYNYGPTYVKSLIERKERVPLQHYQRILTVYKNL